MVNLVHGKADGREEEKNTFTISASASGSTGQEAGERGAELAMFWIVQKVTASVYN